MTYLPQNRRYWIGLRLNDTTDQYEWRSGSGLNDSFMEWDGVTPSNNNDNSKNCASVKNSKWELKECNYAFRYLCQSGELYLIQSGQTNTHTTIEF